MRDDGDSDHGWGAWDDGEKPPGPRSWEEPAQQPGVGEPEQGVWTMEGCELDEGSRRRRGCVSNRTCRWALMCVCMVGWVGRGHRSGWRGQQGAVFVARWLGTAVAPIRSGYSGGSRERRGGSGPSI